MKKKLVLPLALALTVSVGSACFGQFAATRMLYNFNSSVTDSKFVHTLVLWALIILPGYELAGLADFFILNVIEFWTGNNLLAEHVAESDRRLARAQLQQEPDGSLTITRGDQTFSVVPLDEHRVAVSEGDKLLGVTEQQADGSLAMYDADGALLRTISAEQVAVVEQQRDQLPSLR